MLTSIIFLFSHILLATIFIFTSISFPFHFRFTCIYLLLYFTAVTYFNTLILCCNPPAIYSFYIYLCDFFLRFCICHMCLLLLLGAGELKTCCWQCLMSSQPQDVHKHRRTYTYIFVHVYRHMYVYIYIKNCTLVLYIHNMQVVRTQGSVQLLTILPTQIQKWYSHTCMQALGVERELTCVRLSCPHTCG